MKWKQILLVVGISAATTFGSIWTYNKFFNQSVVIGSAQNGMPANYAGFFDGKSGSPAEMVDLTHAAAAASPAVVHIKTRIPAKKQTNNLPRRQNSMFDDWFNDLFGNGYGPNIVPEQRASGSGVIISDDGYIVTNNHVISDQ